MTIPNSADNTSPIHTRIWVQIQNIELKVPDVIIDIGKRIYDFIMWLFGWDTDKKDHVIIHPTSKQNFPASGSSSSSSSSYSSYSPQSPITTTGTTTTTSTMRTPLTPVNFQQPAADTSASLDNSLLIRSIKRKLRTPPQSQDRTVVNYTPVKWNLIQMPQNVKFANQKINEFLTFYNTVADLESRNIGKEQLRSLRDAFIENAPEFYDLRITIYRESLSIYFDIHEALTEKEKNLHGTRTDRQIMELDEKALKKQIAEIKRSVNLKLNGQRFTQKTNEDLAKVTILNKLSACYTEFNDKQARIIALNAQYLHKENA